MRGCRERVGWLHSIPKPLCSPETDVMLDKPLRTKRNRINTAVIMALAEGDIALPGDKTLRGSPERNLQRVSKLTSTSWQKLLCKEQLGAIRGQFSSTSGANVADL